MVSLDKWDSHLDCAISDDGLEATCLHKDGFQYMWKGVRGTHGVTGGTFMFEVKIIENLRVNMPDTTAKNQNIVRVGCSLPLSSLFLGDTAEGWGWGGTGKKSNNSEFTEFGGPFGPGDVIGVIMDCDTLSLSFSRNGKFVGTAFSGLDPAVKTVGLFPHILLKNVRVQVNFSKVEAWYPPPSNVYFLNDATSFDMVDNPIEHPRRMEEAEFIMMVGLPACGKTYWAMKHMENNPKKGYTLLGTNTVIDQMKVVGLNRKGNYAERWQELISMATPCFNKLCEIAGKSSRNIILDQTNVFPKARARKVEEYVTFGTRRAVVIVNDDDTLQQRTEKREAEEGKFVPVDAIMGMKQNFSRPQLSEGFTHIEYAEAPDKESKSLIKAYNEAGWDYKRRNPGKGRSAKPNSPLDQRNTSELTFDRHGYIGSENDGAASSARKRSRSPVGAAKGGQGAKGRGKGAWGSQGGASSSGAWANGGGDWGGAQGGAWSGAGANGFGGGCYGGGFANAGYGGVGGFASPASYGMPMMVMPQPMAFAPVSAFQSPVGYNSGAFMDAYQYYGAPR